METIHFHRMEKSILDIMQNILFVFHKKKEKVIQAWKYINYFLWELFMLMQIG